MASPQSADLLIAGGGLAGLAAAAMAARAGLSVDLFERSTKLGGRALTRTPQGFSLNLGPHALYRRGPAEEVLKTLDVAYSGAAPVQAGWAIHQGRLHRLPAGSLSLLTTSLMSPGTKVRFARWFTGIARQSTAAWANATWADYLAELSPDVATLARALGRLSTYGDDPPHMGAGQTLAQLQSALRHGVRYLDGGWQTLVDGLAATAEAAGARLHTGQGVEQLLAQGSVQGLQRSDGTRWQAPAVLLAVDPSGAARLVAPHLPQRAQIYEPTRPALAACLDVALSRLPRPGHTFALGIDQPWYLSVHSAAAKLAPPDGAVVHVLRYLGPSPTGSAEELAGELEGVLELVQPGWRKHLVARQFLPRMVASASLPRCAGDLAATVTCQEPGLPGLYLAGDWVGSDGLLVDASLASARAAIDAVCRVRGEKRPRAAGAAPVGAAR